MKFKPTRSGSPCPLCGDTSGKCRTTSSDLVLCMTLESAPGYRSLGLTTNSAWTKFIPDRDETTEQREQRYRDNHLRKQLAAQAEAQRHAEAMPAQKRDYYYRQLLSQLSLHPEDRADLERRGYSPEQIKDAGYKSVERFQRLEFPLPHFLPGVQLSGRSPHQFRSRLPVPDSQHRRAYCRDAVASEGGERWPVPVDVELPQ